MSVAHDLQTTVSRISEAIAGRNTFGRVELEQLRRELTAIREEASRDHANTVVMRSGLRQLADGVDDSVVTLNALARRIHDHVIAEERWTAIDARARA